MHSIKRKKKLSNVAIGMNYGVNVYVILKHALQEF